MKLLYRMAQGGDSTLMFQILWMDPRARNSRCEFTKRVTDILEVCIHSVSEPCLYLDSEEDRIHVYLRGDFPEVDFQISREHFNGFEGAIPLIEGVMREWAISSPWDSIHAPELSDMAVMPKGEDEQVEVDLNDFESPSFLEGTNMDLKYYEIRHPHLDINILISPFHQLVQLLKVSREVLELVTDRVSINDRPLYSSSGWTPRMIFARDEWGLTIPSLTRRSHMHELYLQEMRPPIMESDIGSFVQRLYEFLDSRLASEPAHALLSFAEENQIADLKGFSIIKAV